MLHAFYLVKKLDLFNKIQSWVFVIGASMGCVIQIKLMRVFVFLQKYLQK